MSQSGKSAVTQTAAQRVKKGNPKAVKEALESNQTSAVTAVLVAAAVGAFLFWRNRKNDTSKRPGGSKGGTQSAKTSASALPRNKAAAGNKKKDKVRKWEERERRAEKREQQANKPQMQAQSEQREPDPNNDKLILNYNHYVPNI